jgi:hypothetical protein
VSGIFEGLKNINVLRECLYQETGGGYYSHKSKSVSVDVEVFVSFPGVQTQTTRQNSLARKHVSVTMA